MFNDNEHTLKTVQEIRDIKVRMNGHLESSLKKVLAWADTKEHKQRLLDGIRSLQEETNRCFDVIYRDELPTKEELDVFCSQLTVLTHKTKTLMEFVV
jgi:hypothetical protein